MNKFTQKIMNATDTPKELLLLAFGSIVSIGVIFSELEHSSIFDGIWWAFTTAFTIGYGDLYPTMIATKVLAIVLVLFVTLFLLPLIIGNVATRMIVSRDVFTNEEQEEIKADLKAIKSKLNIKE